MNEQSAGQSRAEKGRAGQGRRHLVHDMRQSTRSSPRLHSGRGWTWPAHASQLGAYLGPRWRLVLRVLALQLLRLHALALQLLGLHVLAWRVFALRVHGGRGPAHTWHGVTSRPRWAWSCRHGDMCRTRMRLSCVGKHWGAMQRADDTTADYQTSRAEPSRAELSRAELSRSARRAARPGRTECSR